MNFSGSYYDSQYIKYNYNILKDAILFNLRKY